MKFLKSLLMGTGTVVLAGSALALLVPKAVHAIAATAVQVVNTLSNPVITGEASMQASQIVTINCEEPPGFSNIFCRQVKPDASTSGLPGPNGGYVVPKNAYFVLKSIDSVLAGGVGSGAPYYIGISGIPVHGVFEGIFLQNNGQVSFSSGIVVGPGQEVSPIAIDQGFAPGGGNIYLHGYLTSN